MRLNARLQPILVLSISLIWPFYILAQEGEFCNGLILDSEDRKSVAFATIRVKNHALGVISNEDGSFRFPRELQSYGDSLEISSLGYRDKIIRISTFQFGKTQIILLEPSYEPLDEVVVTAEKKRLSAEKIVANAIRNIPRNYPISPYSYIGYYRDYQFTDDQYTNLNEAIIQVYDRGFESIDYETTEARILKIQKNNEFPRDSTISKPYNYATSSKTIPKAFIEGYSGNELIILRIHDAVRNHSIDAYSYVHRMIDDFLNNHSFEKEGIFGYKGDRIYKISIHRENIGTRVNGEIFISASDYGIVKMEYNVQLINRKVSPSKNSTVRTWEKPLYSIRVEYDRQDLYYPNYLSFKNFFEVKLPPVFFVKSMTWDKDQKYFELNFSTPADRRDINKVSNYKFTFYNEKIKIESAIVNSDGTQVKLIPRKTPDQARLLRLIEEEDLAQEHFEVKFGKIRDLDGNLINESEMKGVEQYREFFVQQKMVDEQLPSKEELMRKNEPIFGDQPIFTGDLEMNYWMNTPLKK